MEIILAIAGIAGAALFLQSKPLPSADDLKKAKDKLAQNPDDPEANRVLGKYLAFVAGDYVTAMPYLSKSGDKILKPVADHELDPSYVDTTFKKIGMGDEWVIAAKGYVPLARIFYDRASYWYGQAWPFLDGVWKDRTREQLRKLFQNPGIQDPKGISAPKDWKIIDTNQKAAPTMKAARTGKSSFQVAAAKNKADEYVSLEQALTPIPGKTYDFSAWALSDGTDSAKDVVSAVFFGQGGNMMGLQVLFIPQDQPWWHKLGTSFVMPQGAALLQVHIGIASKTGNIFVDDVSVKVEGKEMLKNPSFEG